MKGKFFTVAVRAFGHNDIALNIATSVRSRYETSGPRNTLDTRVRHALPAHTKLGEEMSSAKREQLQAVLLADTFATRFAPITSEKPKVLRRIICSALGGE